MRDVNINYLVQQSTVGRTQYGTGVQAILSRTKWTGLAGGLNNIITLLNKVIDFHISRVGMTCIDGAPSKYDVDNNCDKNSHLQWQRSRVRSWC